MLRRALPLVSLAVPVVTWAAAPPLLPVTGYLVDSADAPVDGPVTMHLALYVDGATTTTLWSEDQDVDVDQGQFTVYLGDVAPLALDTFRDNGVVFLGITIGTGAEMTPRFEVATAPFAAYAQYSGDAATVGGISPADLLTSTSGVDWAELTNVPTGLSDGDQDTTYTSGTGLTLTGTTFAADQAQVELWAQGVAYDTPAELRTELDAVYYDTPAELRTELDAVYYDSTADLRLDLDPVYAPNVSCPTDQVLASDGIGGWTCSDVNDLPINASLVALGTLNVARLPVGTTSGTVAAGDHTHTLTTLLGTIGTSPAWPGVSCLDIKTKNPASTSGVYWLNWEGDGRSAYRAYCDMTTNGGGWTMCYTQDATAMVRLQTQYDATPAYGTSGYRSDCRNIPFKDVLYVNHTANQSAWFTRDVRTDITMAANYNASGNVYGLWTGGGVANTSYKYQLNVCDTNWMWVGLMMSGRVGCDKACGSWCSDTTTEYYRTDGDDGGSYNGVSFRENGHTNVGAKTMSVGIR
jgi:hypothetical protein